jgi:choice-of-anchor C domain-containing protein
MNIIAKTPGQPSRRLGISRTALLSIGAVLAIASAASPAAAAPLITNGSFEIGTDPGATFTPLLAGSTAITGWTVGGFGVDYIGGYWQASDGVRSVDLSNLNQGSVSQTFHTIPGSVYTVTFDLSGNPDAGATLKTAIVSIGGSLTQIETYLVGPSNSHSQMNWETRQYQFTAFDNLSTLVFASNDRNPFGPALDNISAIRGDGTGSDVPEPANWALMLIGFTMIGVAARRRGHESVTA